MPSLSSTQGSRAQIIPPLLSSPCFLLLAQKRSPKAIPRIGAMTLGL